MKIKVVPLFYVISLLLLFHAKVSGQTPSPTAQQLAWHKDRFYLFIHFGPNTFTDLEWGHGDEDKNIFNPPDLDVAQWCRVAQQSGASGIIITAKHHDGYCLWPSKFTTHSVAFSSWQDGKGDVLKALSEACRNHGLNFGVYLSPWDRNHPLYGTEAYNDIFINMMGEIFNQYGPIHELWWDGANGEGPNGKKQEYDWVKFISFVREKSPETLIFSDVGPDIRWIGNERGIAGATNWNTLNISGFTPGWGAPPQDTLNMGNKYGQSYIPGECDVSIRPGWFYHHDEDDKVKSAKELFELYLKSVGRGANLLLNVPPDRMGRIHQNDSISLTKFRWLLDNNFKQSMIKGKTLRIIDQDKKLNSVALTDGIDTTSYTFNMEGKRTVRCSFAKKEVINTIIVKEDLTKGQQICAGEVHFLDKNNSLVKKIAFTTIGNMRILTFPDILVSGIEIVIRESKNTPAISEIEVFRIDQSLIEKH